MTHNQNLDAQMTLPHCQTPPTDLPQDKQRELGVTLADPAMECHHGQ